MKELLTEFLSTILDEERSTGEVWQTSGKKWAARNRDGDTRYGFDSEASARQWMMGAKPTSDKPEKFGSMGREDPKAQAVSKQFRKDLQKPTDDKSVKPTVPTLDSKAAQHPGMDKVHTAFIAILSNPKPNVAKVRQFLTAHGIKFNEDKNTFYVTKMPGNPSPNDERRKIFGDGKAKPASGELQRAIFDKLQKLGVTEEDLPVVSNTSPLMPSRVIPRDRFKPIGEDGTATRNEDGSVTINNVTYTPVDTKTWVSDQFDTWIKTDGRSSSTKEKQKFKLQLVAVAAAINARHQILSGLFSSGKPTGDGSGTPESVAIINPTPQATNEHIDLIQNQLSSMMTDNGDAVKDAFDALRNTNDPDEAEVWLVEILRSAILSASPPPVGGGSKKLNENQSLSALAENLTVILELKRGRVAIIPQSDNFKASDVISVSAATATDQTPTQLVEQMSSIYCGVSVKFKTGGSSSIKEKGKQTTFAVIGQPDVNKKTRVTLDLLSSANSSVGSLFDSDEEKRAARIDEVRNELQDHVVEVCEYYGFDPSEITTVDDLVDALSNGEPICVNGKVTINPTPQTPLASKKGPFTKKELNQLDEESLRLMMTMQAAWCAIYNTRVLSQGFSSQNWTASGIQEADGISGIAKQTPQRLKTWKTPPGTPPPFTKKSQPDYLTTFNEMVESDEELRTGNPCTLARMRSKK